MEQYDLELIARHGEQDEELKALWEEHVRYEKQIDKFSTKPFLTPEEGLDMKELKKLKLAGKTKIQELLAKYKEQEA